MTHTILGILLILIGFSLRLHVYFVLKYKQCWRLRKLEKLVTTGIFKYIRHPLYLGTILYVCGLTLASTGNYGLTVANLVIIVFVILGTIDHEETIMTMYFGEEYINYVNKTKMLIPYIW
jgi:protein-S-isoprenylcysteine O-methyltransferase Ste14